MKYIKKVAVTPVTPNTGDIIDSMNPGDDHHTNAPSIDAVDNFVSNKTDVTSYQITNTPTHSSGTNSYNLSKVNKLIILNINNIWMNSLTSNTWVTIGTIPNSVCPPNNIYAIGVVVNGDTGNVASYCNIEIGTDGNINIKSPSGVNTLATIKFSICWVIN